MSHSAHLAAAPEPEWSPRAHGQRVTLAGVERATLDELLAHPDGVADLTPADLARTLSQLAALHFALAARVREIFPPVPARAAGDRLLTVDEVAQRISMSSHAVYRRASSFPFTVHVGRYLRFSERGLEEYLESRRGR